MIKNLPQMLRFIIMCMTHKKEIVKLAAAKQLEFILETQGCSLDGAMVAILKAIMKTYPGILNQVSNQKEKGLPQQESF